MEKQFEKLFNIVSYKLIKRQIIHNALAIQNKRVGGNDTMGISSVDTAALLSRQHAVGAFNTY